MRERNVIHGFAPIARADARVLILGTVPSRRSLEAGQYYAHPRNAFWPIMERLFASGAEPGEAPSCARAVDTGLPAGLRLDYEARVELLLAAKVALWDVLRTAERPGSLDAHITAPVANDFAAFFTRHLHVRTVFFNGTAAAELWRRHVASTLRTAPGPGLVTLPSTSPAHAAVGFAEKLVAWRAVRDALSGD